MSKADKLKARYIADFCKKHEVEFDGIAEPTGTVLWFADDTVLNYEDVMIDVDMNIPVGLIQEWFWDYLETEQKTSYTDWLRARKII